MRKNIIVKSDYDLVEVFGQYIGKPMKYVSIESSEDSQCVVDINVILNEVTFLSKDGCLILIGKDLDVNDAKNRRVKFYMESNLMVSGDCIVSTSVGIDNSTMVRALYPLNMVMHGDVAHNPDFVKSTKAAKKGK